MADNNFFTLNDINMPYSMDAEQAVLGCILSYPECLDRVSFLETKHFFIPQHKDIYSAIMTLSSSGTNIDPLVVLDMLVPDTFDKDQGRQYLLNMAQSVPSTANVELYAKIVRENYVIRSLITISSDIIEDAVNKKSTAGELIERPKESSTIFHREEIPMKYQSLMILSRAVFLIHSRNSAATKKTGIKDILPGLRNLITFLRVLINPI
ncbi:MAG: hypothetical protein IKY00_06875 [Clostridia bacterium]|nr:hypothetical protein [Clostridia bacterium]